MSSKRLGRLLILTGVVSAAACDCGSLEAAHDTFCQKRPAVCGQDGGGPAVDAGSPDASSPPGDAGPPDSGSPDAGAGVDAGRPLCSGPLITEPKQNQPVGEAIKILADAGACIQELTAYLDSDAGGIPAINDNDGGPATFFGNAFPLPPDNFWISVSCGWHTIVVLGTDVNGYPYVSQTVQFERTYNKTPDSGPCDSG